MKKMSFKIGKLLRITNDEGIIEMYLFNRRLIREYKHYIMHLSFTEIKNNTDVSDRIKFEVVSFENLQDCKGGSFSLDYIEKLFHKYNDKYIGVIAYINREPAGYAFTLLRGTEDWQYKIRNIDAYINRVFVFEKYRGQRLATKMINYTIEILKEKNIKDIYLGVKINNQSAINAYEYMGFNILAKKDLFVLEDGLFLIIFYNYFDIMGLQN